VEPQELKLWIKQAWMAHMPHVSTTWQRMDKVDLFCEDCTAPYRAEMAAEGRCARVTAKPPSRGGSTARADMPAPLARAVHTP
jgi:hypothetical protein